MGFRGFAIQSMVKAFSVIKVKVVIKSSVKLNTILKDIQVDAFVLYTLSKVFYGDIVNGPTFSFHADLYFLARQQFYVFQACKLTPLTRVNYLRLSVHFNSFLDKLATPLSCQ